MKKILLSLLMITVIGISTASAYDIPVDEDLQGLNWQELKCEITKRHLKGKDYRSISYIPKLYKSEEFIYVQSYTENCSNAHITVTDSQGETVKDDIIQVIGGGDNLYYIGGLDSGAYEVKLETDDFVMTGNFMM